MNAAVLVLDRHRDALARALPFALYILFLAATPLIAGALPHVDQRWLYALQVGAVGLTLALLWRQYVELGAGPVLRAGQWAIRLAAGVAVFGLWISLDLPWFRMDEGGPGFDPRGEDGRIDWPLAAVRLLGAAVIVPVMEELFWRSFLMRWVDRPDFLNLYPALVSLRALAITALVFGVEHNLWLAGVIAGLVYGGLYLRTCNLWSPILAHAVTNLLLGIWILQTGHWRFW